MKVVRVGTLLGLAALWLGSCGPQIPPAGNYATISGRVTDANSGVGIPFAIVSVNVVQSATSDASGNFKITSVPTGPWSYAVQAPNGYTGPGGSDHDAPLLPGEKRVLNILLTHT